jgi:hypothetical protein
MEEEAVAAANEVDIGVVLDGGVAEAEVAADEELEWGFVGLCFVPGDINAEVGVVSGISVVISLAFFLFVLIIEIVVIVFIVFIVFSPVAVDIGGTGLDGEWDVVIVLVVILGEGDGW